ncbi:hypothetical protein [Streptomyces sp. NBC_00996]|uniref:hypothetical protein n=1 Tax=Streptomyces sp. NBC_00996 TaxID=2903710 RepID=UPI003865833F|nr:hypothetical protein OG390_49700 [Streptomyces sp. NBC_00996]
MVMFDGDGPVVVPSVTVGEADEPAGEAVPADAVPGVGPAHAGADKVSPDKVIAAVTAVTVTRPCLSLIFPLHMVIPDRGQRSGSCTSHRP